MRFIVLNKKQIIIFTAIIAVAIGVVLLSGRAVMTFLVGDRQIPIYSVERADNKISLTFDCAWNDDDIDEIISILKQNNCTATFFVTGKWAESYSDSLNKLHRSGFEIGVHSYNHDDYTKMSPDEILADIEKTEKAIMRATGEKPLLVRTPSGAYNNIAVSTIENSGRYCIQWSVDGLDYVDTTKKTIYERVVPNTKSGDIILLHNGTKLTAQILPDIVKGLKTNYNLVNVSDLIYKEKYTIDNTGRQYATDSSELEEEASHI